MLSNIIKKRKERQATSSASLLSISAIMNTPVKREREEGGDEMSPPQKKQKTSSSTKRSLSDLSPEEIDKLKLRATLLTSSKTLAKLYNTMVKERKLLTAEEFWTDWAAKLQADSVHPILQQRGVPSKILEIQPVSTLNDRHYTLSTTSIEDIILQYPMLTSLHEKYVKKEEVFNKEQFWKIVINLLQNRSLPAILEIVQVPPSEAIEKICAVIQNGPANFVCFCFCFPLNRPQ